MKFQNKFKAMQNQSVQNGIILFMNDDYEMDYNDPKACRDRLGALLDRAEKLKVDVKDPVSRDVFIWQKSMNRFIRLAWSDREFALPATPKLGEIVLPPFSEQVNPSNRESVPSCFYRIARDHFAFASNKAALLLIDDFDFYLQFDAFFRELGALCNTESYYNARSAFLEFVHRFKYYVRTIWLRHLAKRRDYQLWTIKLAEKFKELCKPLSLDLYKLEHGEPIPFKGPVYFEGETTLQDEADFQQKIFFGKHGHHNMELEMKEKPKVSRALAARICGVQYNTIKNWETKGPSPAACDYPGRCDLDKLVEFSNRYCDRIGTERVAKRWIKPS